MNGETARRIVNFLLGHPRPVTAKKVAKELGLSESTVRRYLNAMKELGLVEAIKRGRTTRYILVKEPSEEEIRRIAHYNKETTVGEPDVYVLARKILKALKEEAMVPGDLLGAAKIHLVVGERHRRITHDVDIAVPPEFVTIVAAYLKEKFGFIQSRKHPHVDVRLYDPIRELKIDVMGGSFRENGKVVFDLSKILRERGELTLEEVLIAKMTRRSFEKRSDGIDVLAALPLVDEKKWRKAVEELRTYGSPELFDRLFKAMDIVKEVIEEEEELPAMKRLDKEKLTMMKRVAKEILK